MGKDGMDDNDMQASEISRKHFEEAFASARRSVGTTDLAKYDHFRKKFDPVYMSSTGWGTCHKLARRDTHCRSYAECRRRGRPLCLSHTVFTTKNVGALDGLCHNVFTTKNVGALDSLWLSN